MEGVGQSWGSQAPLSGKKESENNLIVTLTITWKGGTECFYAFLGKKPLPGDLLSSIRSLTSHFLLSFLRRFWMRSQNIDLPSPINALIIFYTIDCTFRGDGSSFDVFDLMM